MADVAIQGKAIVTLIVGGVSYDKWDQKTGGERTAANLRYRSGGNLEESLSSGLPTTAQIVLTRGYDRARDHALLNALAGKVGNGSVTVSWQPCDANMIPTADPAITRSGLLAGTPSLGPDYDSNSSDAATIQVTLDVV